MNAAAIQEAQKAEEEQRKAWEVQGWNAGMPSLLAVQRTALEGRSCTTYYCCRQYNRQEATAGRSSGQTGPSGEPDFRWEQTRRGLLDRLGRSNNAYRAEDPFSGGESDVPVGFGSEEDQFHSDDDVVSESDSGALKRIMTNSR